VSEAYGLRQQARNVHKECKQAGTHGPSQLRLSEEAVTSRTKMSILLNDAGQQLFSAGHGITSDISALTGILVYLENYAVQLGAAPGRLHANRKSGKKTA
jgi:hypothetical protein